MNLKPVDQWFKAAFAGTCLAWALAAQAQTPTAPPAPVTAVAAPAMPAVTPMAGEPQKPMKRRVVRRVSRPTCEAVNDPWSDLCTIRKHAQVACSDLALPKSRGKAPRASRRGTPAAVSAPGNPRQECFDAYMRNV